MLSVEEALERILAAVHSLETEKRTLWETSGLVLAENIYAQEDLPPFANSAMDGFALRSEDSQRINDQLPQLRVIGEIGAGYVSQQKVEPGTTLRIMTGAPIPVGADSVIQVEHTRAHEDRVEILEPVSPGNNIRPIGEDMRREQQLLTRGTVIGPWEIGVLATIGRAHVPVIRPPRVAIIATGDELVNIDQPLAPGKIRNSNSYLLEAAVRRAGGLPQRLGVAHDTEESLNALFKQAATFDLILTSGGVSVGDFDLVKQMMMAQGQVDFWRINMRPGKPVAFGRIAGVPLLGLPGNPVSTAVTFELFGRPLIRKLGGQSRLTHPQVEVTVEDTITERGSRRHYVRALVRNQERGLIARTTGNQGSHITTSLLYANALLIIPENSPVIQPGERLQALLLDWPL